MKFCERLKLARTYAKLTQQELVDRLGTKEDGRPLMAQSNLAKMELSQEAKGSIYSAIIANVCQVNPLWLANEIGEMTENQYMNNNSLEAKVLHAMQNMDAATKYQLVKISDSLAESTEKPNGTQK